MAQQLGKATGCYKCGKTGHWSRDCPQADNSTAAGKKEAQTSKALDNLFNKNNAAPENELGSQQERDQKNLPRVGVSKRRLPSVEWLESVQGLPALCKEIPKSMRFKGKGHEREDLKKVLEKYIEWQKQSFPKLNFRDFLEKVALIRRKKRLQDYLNTMRKRVQCGEDPVTGSNPEKPPHAESSPTTGSPGAFNDEMATLNKGGDPEPVDDWEMDTPWSSGSKAGGLQHAGDHLEIRNKVIEDKRESDGDVPFPDQRSRKQRRVVLEDD